MKRTIIYLASAIVSLYSLTSCSDFLTEKTNGQVFDNVLTEQAGLDAALTGAYNGLNSPWSWGICNGTFHQMLAGGDDIYCPTTDANGTQFDRCNVSDSNGSFGSTWNGLYKTVMGANTVINHYEKCSGSEEIITQIAGEAYFLRAYAYFMLVRTWGEIPLILSDKYTEEDALIEPSSEAAIYELIESDIDNAVRMLGTNRRNNEVGRPNSLVARALRAEIYLTEAGWPLKKEGYYEKAAIEAKAVLDASESLGFKLEENFADLFINKEEEDCITSEDLFVIPASTNEYVVYYGAWSEPSEIGGWDIVFAEVGFMEKFPEGIRKDLTFYTKCTNSEGEEISWENWKCKHPGLLKLMKYPQGGANNVANCNSVLPVHLLRLSQTALTYAEAAARSTGAGTDAYYWINEIRERAGLAPLSGLSNDEFIEACVNERAWEFASEFVRWYDLLRLEEVEKSFENKNFEYDQTNLHTSGERYTFPIPSYDSLINPNLKK